ncbi:hypothetical protein BHE97_03605 [Aeromicrobium sp. PE09-221]|uniref:PTS sugar transporter subunit IIA n=1 Tax=Aeromicrobium sp. PE09-221 TaxID=1898043 RepID=UPI000B3EDBFA|nr:PTS sugar transporter subunit IIA [Aeromicrobium sp. PE09-221]OUZ11970.1 hypothetical protein BHE97_03605 [Aeromicrobium sp. PE09-221]
MTATPDPVPSPELLGTRIAATDWTDAVRAAGQLLVDAGRCTTGYVEAMQDAVRDLGPYMVVAPGVAMPHARPESGVLAPGVAIVTLASPVAFGHAANDPVDLVIAFAAIDKDAHLATLQRIVSLIQDDATLGALRSAPDETTAAAILRDHHDPALNPSRSQQ